MAPNYLSAGDTERSARKLSFPSSASMIRAATIPHIAAARPRCGLVAVCGASTLDMNYGALTQQCLSKIAHYEPTLTWWPCGRQKDYSVPSSAIST
jgi:hypothetical protein